MAHDKVNGIDEVDPGNALYWQITPRPNPFISEDHEGRKYDPRSESHDDICSPPNVRESTVLQALERLIITLIFKYGWTFEDFKLFITNVYRSRSSDDDSRKESYDLPVRNENILVSSENQDGMSANYNTDTSNNKQYVFANKSQDNNKTNANHFDQKTDVTYVEERRSTLSENRKYVHERTSCYLTKLRHGEYPTVKRMVQTNSRPSNFELRDAKFARNIFDLKSSENSKPSVTKTGSLQYNNVTERPIVDQNAYLTPVRCLVNDNDRTLLEFFKYFNKFINRRHKICNSTTRIGEPTPIPLKIPANDISHKSNHQVNFINTTHVPQGCDLKSIKDNIMFQKISEINTQLLSPENKSQIYKNIKHSPTRVLYEANDDQIRTETLPPMIKTVTTNIKNEQDKQLDELISQYKIKHPTSISYMEYLRKLRSNQDSLENTIKNYHTEIKSRKNLFFDPAAGKAKNNSLKNSYIGGHEPREYGRGFSHEEYTSPLALRILVDKNKYFQKPSKFNNSSLFMHGPPHSASIQPLESPNRRSIFSQNSVNSLIPPEIFSREIGPTRKKQNHQQTATKSMNSENLKLKPLLVNILNPKRVHGRYNNIVATRPPRLKERIWKSYANTNYNIRLLTSGTDSSKSQKSQTTINKIYQGDKRLPNILKKYNHQNMTTFNFSSSPLPTSNGDITYLPKKFSNPSGNKRNGFYTRSIYERKCLPQFTNKMQPSVNLNLKLLTRRNVLNNDRNVHNGMISNRVSQQTFMDPRPPALRNNRIPPLNNPKLLPHVNESLVLPKYIYNNVLPSNFKNLGKTEDILENSIEMLWHTQKIGKSRLKLLIKMKNLRLKGMEGGQRQLPTGNVYKLLPGSRPLQQFPLTHYMEHMPSKPSVLTRRWVDLKHTNILLDTRLVVDEVRPLTRSQTGLDVVSHKYDDSFCIIL